MNARRTAAACAVALLTGLAGCAPLPRRAPHAASAPTPQATAATRPAAAPQAASRHRPAAATPPAGGVRSPAGLTVVLDPGHGSHSGAHSAAGAWEDDNVLAIARDTAALLRAAGVGVRLTRDGPSILGSADDTDLTARVADAARWRAAVFVSLHQNFSSAAGQTGVETFFATPDSRRLAEDVQHAVAAGTGLADRGIAHRVYWVVACNRMPAILVEGGFLSNPAEAARISTKAFQKLEARALSTALTAYLENARNPVSSRPLPPRLASMCALGPVRARTWVREHWHRPPAGRRS